MFCIFLFGIVFLSITSKSVYGKDICTFSNSTYLKLCRYRDEGLVPIDFWREKTGAGCYQYFQNQWFSDRIRILYSKYESEEFNCTVPIGNVTSVNKLITFDYQNEDSLNYILSSFENDLYFSKWKDCATNADVCCSTVMNDYNIYYDDEYQCPTTWDAWSCFNSAKNGTIGNQPCPTYTSSSEEVPCILYSEKECFPNGTWDVTTNYGTCATAVVYRRRHNFNVIILYVSVALSLPAVFIFVSYKNLRILRVNLHRNLLIACILRNIFTILTKELVILDSLKPSDESNNVLTENGVPCRVLAYFNSVCANAIYACMLIDGYYLHKLIVRIFNKDPNIYLLYLVMFVLSFLPTSIWAIVVAIKSNNHCWVVDTEWYQWIPDGFRIAILCVNIILLLDIIRALCRKLRRNVTAQETKSTLKATFFLLPLFGVPFILIANRSIVDSSSCRAGDIYYYISYSIQALQSVVVAILFCYWNKEVHNQIIRTYRRLRISFNDCFGIKKQNINARRDTAATYVPNHNSSVVAPVTEVKAKVTDWLTDNPVEENTEQNNAQINHFEDISRFIDDSVDNSTTLDNNGGESIEINKTNLNVKFVKN